MNDLTAAGLQIRFRNSTFVKHFFFHDTIASTNDAARRLAEGGADEGTLVVANGQTGGRGRAGRSWFSPPGQGLYVSFLLRPGTPPETAFGVHMAVTLGAAATAESEGPQAVIGIKWPNDLVAEGKKLCGILSETGFQGGRLRWCVVGVGLNVHHGLQDFPPDLRDRAVSLDQLCRRRLDRTELLIRLVAGVESWYRRFQEEGIGPLNDEWRRRSTVLGRMIRVETPGETYVGTAVSLEDDGSLRIRLESGAEEILRAGDVHLVQYR